MEEIKKRGGQFINLKEKAKQLESGKVYSIQEVADIFQIYHRTIRHAIERGEIQPQKLGRQYLIRKEDFFQ